jgi:hypothetical protein
LRKAELLLIEVPLWVVAVVAAVVVELAAVVDDDVAVVVATVAAHRWRCFTGQNPLGVGNAGSTNDFLRLATRIGASVGLLGTVSSNLLVRVLVVEAAESSVACAGQGIELALSSTSCILDGWILRSSSKLERNMIVGSVVDDVFVLCYTTSAP